MSIKEKIRIIIDANVWVDFAIGHHVHRLRDILYNKNNIVFICTEIENEFLKAVTQSERIRKYVKQKRIDDTIDLMNTFCISKKHHSDINVSRDAKDNYLLGFSINCKANFLITGDNDLLVLQKFKNTLIIELPVFLELVDRKI